MPYRSGVVCYQCVDENVAFDAYGISCVALCDQANKMSELVSTPSSGVSAAISVLGHRLEWEIGWVSILGLLLTLVVGYGNLCFYVGQKLQESRTPVKVQKAVPEGLWLAKATGQKYHIYEDCGTLDVSIHKVYNSCCAQCLHRSRLSTFKVK